MGMIFMAASRVVVEGVDVVLVMTASVNEGPCRRSFGHHVQFDDDAIYDSNHA